MLAEYQRRLQICIANCSSTDPVACVPDDEVLTQYGRVDGHGALHFYDRPKPGQYELSMLRGQLKAEDACRRVLGARAVPKMRVGARARYISAGVLRDAGLGVAHTPGFGSSDGHVSVSWPPDRLPAPDVTWPNEVAGHFANCFTDHEGGSE